VLRLGLVLLAASMASGAFAQGKKDIAPRDAPSNFDRTHRAIDKTMQTGNDRSPPLGSGPGERPGLGGAPGGGAGPRTQNIQEIQKRHQ